jgi:hypothetical protein
VLQFEDAVRGWLAARRIRHPLLRIRVAGPSEQSVPVGRAHHPHAVDRAYHLAAPFRRLWLLVPLVAGLVLCAVSVAWQLAKARGWQPASLQLDNVLNVDEDDDGADGGLVPSGT